jgi:glutathione synthase/RimK-type ligase-like ATP-grasp enzyme
MSKKRIGLLYGMERSFPPALAQRIHDVSRGEIVAEPVVVGAVRQDARPPYDLILDRISHEVPFYRAYLKAAAALGVQVVNNPFWWSADDKFLNNVIAQSVGVAVPKTVILPHKSHPPNTTGDSFSNLEFPLRWNDVFDYLGFPIFLKPADGGGWKNVFKVSTPAEFFAAYDTTSHLCMMAQEAIAFTAYFRCYAIGRRSVRIMAYNPNAPHAERYVRNGAPIEPTLSAKLQRDCLALCRALGYDFNTLEFAVQGGIPYAIDFMNPAPDCDAHSVGPDNFEWVLQAAAEFLVERVRKPQPLELGGEWAARARAAEASPRVAPMETPARKPSRTRS